MLEWLKRKAIAKQKSNIAIILGNLVPICSSLDEEIKRTGAPVRAGAMFELLQKQRAELQFQLNGPMSMAEVRSYLQEFIQEKRLQSDSLRLAAVSVVDQFQKETGRA
ncbi:MAG: hypothetical protein H6807_14005 [Planctomycetes bacterium]|nr:hypothetical protein [Planctomycetota bacterium]